MKKTMVLLAVLVLLLGLTACALQESPPQESSDVGTASQAAVPAEDCDYTLRVGQMGTSIKAAMVVLAHESGFYEEEGLDVTLEPINNLNDGLTAILGGSLDILPFGVIPTCTFVSQGADLTIIGGTIAEGSQAVILPENVSSFTPGDLTWFSGKTVACVRAETGHMLMQAKIREAGIDMSAVSFVELDGFQSVVEAVSKGEADIGFVNSGFGQNAVQQGLEILFDVGAYAPDAVCCRQTALRSSVEANRDAYVRFEVANLRAMKLMLEDEAQTVETLAAFSGQDREYVWNCIYDGVMKISMDPCANRVQEFYSAMIANGDISASADPDITGHVDSTIYYDALTEVISRYPDFQPYGEMMDRYAGNNL